MPRTTQPLLWLALAVLLFTAGGASCPRQFVAQAPPPPAAFIGPPTLTDVIDAVNVTNRVQQLQTQNATLSVPGLPSLRADLALQRPRDFRLRASLTQLTGQELDLGSNPELFWMWVKRAPQSAIYFARHEQYAQTVAPQLLPVEPHWLIDALGLVQLDPWGFHEGPFPRGADQLEIRSRVPSAQGDLTRVLIVHDRYAWILEQHLYDSRGALVATARASNHRFYPEQGVSLPHHVDIQLGPGRPTAMSFGIDIDKYSINQLYSDPNQLFSLPSISGYPQLDLADPTVQIPGLAGPPAPQNASGYRPEFRGYSRR